MTQFLATAVGFVAGSTFAAAYYWAAERVDRALCSFANQTNEEGDQ